jgi:hypothetical protein
MSIRKYISFLFFISMILFSCETNYISEAGENWDAAGEYKTYDVPYVNIKISSDPQEYANSGWQNVLPYIIDNQLEIEGLASYKDLDYIQIAKSDTKLFINISMAGDTIADYTTIEYRLFFQFNDGTTSLVKVHYDAEWKLLSDDAWDVNSELVVAFSSIQLAIDISHFQNIFKVKAYVTDKDEPLENPNMYDSFPDNYYADEDPDFKDFFLFRIN